MKIIILKKGYYGYNVYNVYNNDDYNKDNYDTIFINYINNNNFNYLEPILKNNNELLNDMNIIENAITNNLSELANIMKRNYPVCTKWYPDIFKEMYEFYKYNLLPEIFLYIHLDLKIYPKNNFI